MQRLLLCALRRHGVPATAADATDVAVGLAMDAGWPRAEIELITPQRAAAALRAMAKRGEVERAGIETVEGNDRPLWQPANGRFNATEPVPPPPHREGDTHVLTGMSSAQAMTMFDAVDELAMIGQRNLVEMNNLVSRLNSEYQAAALRMRRRLVSVGIIGDDA